MLKHLLTYFLAEEVVFDELSAEVLRICLVLSIRHIHICVEHVCFNFVRWVFVNEVDTFREHIVSCVERVVVVCYRTMLRVVECLAAEDCTLAALHLWRRE